MNRPSFVVALLTASFAVTAHAGIGAQDSNRQVSEPVLESAAIKQPVVRKSRYATPEEDAVPTTKAKRSPVLLRLRYASAEEMPVTGPDQNVRRDSCLRFTGSRLLRDDRSSQRCAIGGGRVYMSGDVDQASAGTLAEVLRR